MGEAVFTSAVYFPDISDEDREKLLRDLRILLYDELDEREIDYKSILIDFTTENHDAFSKLDDPSENRLGPFASDSDTSRKAALANFPRSGSQRNRILRAVEESRNGMTRPEIAEDLGISENSVRPRVKELIEGGWLEDTDDTRLTDSGQEASVLFATDKKRPKL